MPFTKDNVRIVIFEADTLAGRTFDIGFEDILCDDRFLAPGYGQLNAPTSAAIKMLANREGIMLDPTYTGKAFAALVDRIESEKDWQQSVRH